MRLRTLLTENCYFKNQTTNKLAGKGISVVHKCTNGMATPTFINAPIQDWPMSRKKKWLKPDTPAYIALEAVVLNKKLLKDLKKLTEFCHTREAEVYHS